MAEKEKESLESLSEQQVQERLYGDINGQLKSIRKDIAETKRKLYQIRQSRIPAVVKIFKFLVLVAVCLGIIFIFVRGVKWLGNIKNNRLKEPVAEVAAVVVAKNVDVKYTIQVAVYKNNKDAKAFNKLLLSKGYPAFINIYYSKNGSPRYRVCVGKLQSKAESKLLLERLKKEKDTEDSFLVNLP